MVLTKLVLTAFFILYTTLTYLTYIRLSYLNQSNICTSLVVPRGIENTYLLCVYLLLNLKSSSFHDVVGIKVQNWKIESKNSCTQYWIKWWILIIFYDVIAQLNPELSALKSRFKFQNLTPKCTMDVNVFKSTLHLTFLLVFCSFSTSSSSSKILCTYLKSTSSRKS